MNNPLSNNEPVVTLALKMATKALELIHSIQQTMPDVKDGVNGNDGKEDTGGTANLSSYVSTVSLPNPTITYNVCQ